MNTIPKVKVQQFIRGKREKVFEAWINPKMAAQWFSPENLTPVSFKSDAKVGGNYRHVMKGPPGEITTVGVYKEIILNKKLVFTWGPDQKGIAGSLVTVEFTDQDGGTLVTLINEQLPKDQVDSHASGWQSALRHLQTYFENLGAF